MLCNNISKHDEIRDFVRERFVHSDGNDDNSPVSTKIKLKDKIVIFGASSSSADRHVDL